MSRRTTRPRDRPPRGRCPLARRRARRRGADRGGPPRVLYRPRPRRSSLCFRRTHDSGLHHCRPPRHTSPALGGIDTRLERACAARQHNPCRRRAGGGHPSRRAGRAAVRRQRALGQPRQRPQPAGPAHSSRPEDQRSRCRGVERSASAGPRSRHPGDAGAARVSLDLRAARRSRQGLVEPRTVASRGQHRPDAGCRLQPGWRRGGHPSIYLRTTVTLGHKRLRSLKATQPAWATVVGWLDEAANPTGPDRPDPWPGRRDDAHRRAHHPRAAVLRRP